MSTFLPYLTNLLDSASPWNRKNETTVRELLHRGAERPGYAYALATLPLGKVVAREGRLAEAETLDREGPASLRNFVERGDHRIEEAEQS